MDIESTLKDLESEDNFIHLDSESIYNVNLDTENGEDLHKVNWSNEEKNLKLTLKRIRESAAICDNITSKKDI